MEFTLFRKKLNVTDELLFAILEFETVLVK